MSKPTGGPAFPSEFSCEENQGITVRDYFAAKALQGMTANSYWDQTLFADMAKSAFKQADAMLVARDE